MSTSTDPTLRKLFARVRSLRRWTLATSLVLLSYLVVLVLQVLWFVREDSRTGGSLDLGFVLGLSVSAGAFSVLFALPAWFAMSASHKAAQAHSARSLRPLVASAWWLRRFLIAAGTSLLLYALGGAAALAIHVSRLLNA